MTFTSAELAAGFGVGPCTVFPNRNLVTSGDQSISLEPKIMEVCCLLAAHGGNVVLRDELIDQVWGVKFGSDESLTRAIYLLRKALTQSSGADVAIETVSKKGYRFAVPVVPIDQPTAIRASIINEARPSVAMLAFVDMSASADQGHFSDGVAEEIINALVPLKGIRVAGRTSSFSFKGANKSISEIGSALGVDHILEGSVRRQGDQLRITAQLIDARSDTHIWSHNYHGSVDAVFDLQDEIARSVCEELKVIFHIDDDRSRLAPALTNIREAYDLFLQGRALRARIFGAGVLQLAEDFFKRAIALDPEFAEAWAELGYAYAQIAGYVQAKGRRAVLAQSFAAAQKAIDLKPDYGLAWMVQSWTPLTEGDIAESVRLAGKACRFDPNNPDILIRRGYYLLIIGRVRDALPLLRQAVELDPIQGRNHMVLSLALLADGDVAEADHHAELSIGLQYHVASMPGQLAAQAAGNTELAVERAMQAARTSAASAVASELSTPEIWKMVVTIICSGTDEQRAGLVAQMSAMVTDPARRSEMAYMLVLAGCGIAPAFFEAFGDRAEPGNHLILSALWGPFPPHNKLRKHPEFMAFAERIGLKAAWDIYGFPDCWEGSDDTNCQFMPGVANQASPIGPDRKF